MNKPLVSLILPIYNVAPYLTQCFESLRAQTYRRLEILCLNDGSTDYSQQIIDQFVQKDSRFKSFSHANIGAAATRNKGLKLAQGEYVIFVDPDDWAEPTYIEKLVTKIMQQQADICVCNYQIIDAQTDAKSTDYKKDTIAVFGKENRSYRFPAFQHFFHTTNLGFAPWIKLYKKSFLLDKKITFDTEATHYNDIAFFYESFLRARSFCFVSEKLFNHRQGRPDSLTSNINSQRFISGLKTWKKLRLHIQDILQSAPPDFLIEFNLEELANLEFCFRSLSLCYQLKNFSLLSDELQYIDVDTPFIKQKLSAEGSFLWFSLAKNNHRFLAIICLFIYYQRNLLFTRLKTILR